MPEDLSYLTIQTKPFLGPDRLSYHRIRDALDHVRVLRHRVRTQKTLINLRGRGHLSVTPPLLKGLSDVAGGYHTDRKWVSEPLPLVWVPNGTWTVRQAAALRAQGKIEHLIIGPNTPTITEEMQFYGISGTVDSIVVPSEWVGLMLAREIKSESRIFVWPVGTDTQFWRPSRLSRPNKRHILLYIKDASCSLTSSIEPFLNKRGLEVLRVEYGKYSRTRYRQLLDNCAMMIYLGASESQGLALQEAWSMNVPTLVYQPNKVNISFLNRSTRTLVPGDFSAAPYLSQSTGDFWTSIDQLDHLLKIWDRKEVHARSWVLENLSLEKAARRFVNETLPEICG